MTIPITRPGDLAGAAPALAPVVFSTDGIEAAGRYETWCSQFGDVNDVLVSADSVPNFAAHSEQWRLGPFLYGVNRTPARRLLRSAAHCARDDIDHWVLRVCRTGRVAIRSRGEISIAGPGEVILGNLAAGYDYEWSEGDWVAAIVPRDAFPAMSAGLSALRDGRLRGMGAQLLAEFLLALEARLPQCSAADLPVVTEAMRAMVTACMLGEPAPRSVAPEDMALMQRQRIERLIRRNIGSARLDAGRLCTLAGISRSALYRLFEPDGGVAAYIQRLRLDLVSHDLADPLLAGEPISKLAERRGFHCVPSFNRAFRRAFGRTPGEMRQQALAGVPLSVPGRASAPLEPRSLIELMR